MVGPTRRFIAATIVFDCLSAMAFAQEIATPGRGIVNPLAAEDPAKLDGFLGRPLFSPSRRPSPPPEPSSAESIAQTEVPPEFRLLGIVQMSNENVAQLAEGAGPQRYSVRVGDYLGNWLVTEIDKSSLTILNGEREVKLALFANRAGGIRKAGNASAAEEAGGVWTGTSETDETSSQDWTKEDLKGFFGDDP